MLLMDRNVFDAYFLFLEEVLPTTVLIEVGDVAGNV